jgi:hypothetical protein
MAKRRNSNLKTPERALEMGNGEIWRFRLDNNTIYELEQHTDRPVNEVLADLSPVPDPEWAPDPSNPDKSPRMLPSPRMNMSRIYDLAWAMSASHREDEGINMSFRQFLRILPHPSLMQELIPFVIGLLAEGFRPGSEEDLMGNASAPSPAD